MTLSDNSTNAGPNQLPELYAAPGAPAWARDYWRDAWQRSVLFLDILRQRGNVYLEHTAKRVPHVLDFDAALVCDGRTLARPVNYFLASIVAPTGVKTDPLKAPFIVVDPRAGHGPGIGGMKADSEIGMALADGHACYFIGFSPHPEPGQSVEDVCRAEATFIEIVASRHPQAVGKPVIIANCQAGWQIMMTAALNPDLAGPIMLAGSPLSYWAGAVGQNPMRCSGGMLGGTWLTALTGDIGAGVFDGAHLVANFESLDPANTHWRKPYNVYANVDTEGPRFLDFETWWGSPVLLDAGEMQWIADNLFVGDRLSSGALRASDGTRIDLRNIKSPIIVFCSQGDNITPPQQALGWIIDIYRDDEQLAANGQTIVYMVHPTIGHLGIFVSAKVASKEHREFVDFMDMIDLMPPGLYEAVLVDAPDEHDRFVEGRYIFTLQRRKLDNIRALGVNTAEQDRCFRTAARVSDVNKSLYEAFARPLVRAAVRQSTAETIRNMHPNRLRFSAFSDQNPAMRIVDRLAERVRQDRRPLPPDNPLLSLERLMSSWIGASWEAYGNVRDATMETLFFSIYGSPLLQAMVGLNKASEGSRVERDLVREAAETKLRSELEGRFESGATAEAIFRALIYVHGPDGVVDERGYAMLNEFRASQPVAQIRTMSELKSLLKEQVLLVRLDPERAIAAIPDLLPDDANQCASALGALQRMIAVRGRLTGEGQKRFARIEQLFNGKPAKPAQLEAVHGQPRTPRPRPHA